MVDILHRVGIAATPEKVFNALTTMEGVRAWWCSTATGGAAKNEVTNYGFCDMEVLDAEPAQLVRWRCTGGPSEWLNTEVTFRLEWKDNQTFVMFWHANWKEPVEFMHHCSTKWATFLLSLRDFVENGAGRPLPHDLRIEVNG